MMAPRGHSHRNLGLLVHSLDVTQSSSYLQHNVGLDTQNNVDACLIIACRMTPGLTAAIAL